MKKIEKILLLLLLLAFIFVFSYLFISGSFYTHDDVFHIIRTYNYAYELEQGQFPVRMATQMANGFSYPTFNYTYPLPYFVTALLYMAGLSITLSHKILLAVTSFLSVYFFYLFLRSKKSPQTSFLGALLFLLVPYRFLSVFVTGQLGTTLSFFFVAVLLYLAERMISSDKKKYLVFFSLAVAALILSHLISALIVLPIVALYLVWELFKEKQKTRKKLAGNFLKALFLGFGLSAFYLLPAILEMKYINAGHQATVNYAEHFVSLKQLFYSPWGYGFSGVGFDDLISFQLGLVHILIIASAFFLIFLNFFGKKIIKIFFKKINIPFVITLLLVVLLSVFLMTPYSQIFWENLPVISKLQHPWRLLIVPAVFIPMIAVEILEPIKSNILRYLAFSILILASVYFNRNYLRPMEAVRYQDDHYLKNKAWLYGSGDISHEFLPVDAKFPQGASDYLIDPGLLKDEVEAEQKVSKNMLFNLDNPEEQLVTLNILNFPSWKVSLDGQYLESESSEDGLISVFLPEGEHLLEVNLEQTPIENWGNVLSLISIVLLFFLFI